MTGSENMHRLYQKLNSKSGVSILIALILFLVASMVSVVVIHASLTAIKRVQDDKKREEELLTVSSAARLLERAIKASDVTVTVVHTETETFTEGGESTVRHHTSTDYTGSGPLGNLLEVPVKDGFPASETYVVTVDPDWGDEETLPGCTFTFTVKPYDASYEDSTDSYKIDGVVETAGSRQKVFLTAWIPTTPVPKITTEHDYEEDQESGVSVEETVERRVTRYVWSGVELTTMREEWTDNDNG